MGTVAIPDLSIRPIRPDDLGTINRLERLCFKDPYSPHFISHLARANPDTFLVAVVNGDVVGYGVVNRGIDHNHLVSIAVHSHNRRRGVGTMLLHALEARLDGEKPLRLELRKSNVSALEFYRQCRFVPTGVIPGYYSDGEDAVVMEKM